MAQLSVIKQIAAPAAHRRCIVVHQLSGTQCAASVCINNFRGDGGSRSSLSLSCAIYDVAV